MDNIIFKSIWKDSELMELKVTASAEYINVFQHCYVDDSLLEEIANKIQGYVSDFSKECYLEFGSKTGNYTPAFSLKLLPCDNHGHLKIETDIEIADTEKRTHRCIFYINCELGQIEKFGKSLKLLISQNEGYQVSLL